MQLIYRGEEEQIAYTTIKVKATKEKITLQNRGELYIQFIS